MSKEAGVMQNAETWLTDEQIKKLDELDITHREGRRMSYLMKIIGAQLANEPMPYAVIENIESLISECKKLGAPVKNWELLLGTVKDEFSAKAA